LTKAIAQYDDFAILTKRELLSMGTKLGLPTEASMPKEELLTVISR
jgi:hypothetical protein